MLCFRTSNETEIRKEKERTFIYCRSLPLKSVFISFGLRKIWSCFGIPGLGKYSKSVITTFYPEALKLDKCSTTLLLWKTKVSFHNLGSGISGSPLITPPGFYLFMASYFQWKRPYICMFVTSPGEYVTRDFGTWEKFLRERRLSSVHRRNVGFGLLGF